MYHFVTEMCRCAHFCYKMEHCGIWDWCIVGFAQRVYSSWLNHSQICLIFVNPQYKKWNYFSCLYHNDPKQFYHSLIRIYATGFSINAWRSLISFFISGFSIVSHIANALRLNSLDCKRKRIRKSDLKSGQSFLSCLSSKSCWYSNVLAAWNKSSAIWH